MKAWLVTWEYIGEHAKVDNDIVAILPYRYSPRKVKEVVEQLYANSLGLNDRLRYANDRKSFAYPAEFDSINGIPWCGRITCGHNPWLFARFVDDVKVDSNNENKLIWVERTIPEMNFPPKKVVHME